jgi:hypothetical protein
VDKDLDVTDGNYDPTNRVAPPCRFPPAKAASTLGHLLSIQLRVIAIQERPDLAHEFPSLPPQ